MANHSELADHIYAVVKASSHPLRAQEIAKRVSSRTGKPVDKSLVNQVLYGSLRGRVHQDKRYAWYVRGTGSTPESPGDDGAAPVVRPAEWDRLGRLLSYYLECVREDSGSGARHFLSEDGNRFITLQLEQEWSATGRRQHVEELDGHWGFAKLLRQARGQGALFYGYPLFVDWIERSARGWSGGFAVPVFLQSVEYQLQQDTLELNITPEWPRVNPAFLERAFSSAEERRVFLDELGLLEIEGAPPDDGLADVVRRMAEVGAPVPMVEELDPARLDLTDATSTLSGEGLRNRAVLVIAERSKYTAGLEHELEHLRDKASEEKLTSSSLATIFLGERAPRSTPTPANNDLVEVVSLNDEQREAVQSAFSDPLTVVTGPPGTGKSQVVVTTLANAYLRGQRVLFTSRNNKAVDVVEQRLNALSGFPLIVRAGARSGERDLRAELIQFLTSVLSFQSSVSDRQEAERLGAELRRASGKRDQVMADLEVLREARNSVDSLDAELEVCASKLGQGRWAEVKRVGEEIDLILVDRFADGLGSLTHDAPSLGARLRRRFRWKGLARELHERAAEMHKAGLIQEVPDPPERGEDLRPWRDLLDDVRARAQAIELQRRFSAAKDHLSELGTTGDLASRFALAEEEVWDAAAQLIAVTGQLLPDRLTERLRRAIGEYRATLERLAGDRIGGASYAKLRSEQEQLFRHISEALPIWCVTNMSARGALPMEGALFDLAIIDEASQCDIPSALPVLFRAKRAMIIGDPNQLSHISSLDRAREQQLQARHGLDSAADQPFTFNNNSLFGLAATHATSDRVVALYEHFRSHRDIVEYSNRTWYRGKLRIATDYRRLRGTSGPAVRWTSVQGQATRPSSGGAINQAEAERVVRELESLLRERDFRGTVGIVTPFRAQANRIRDLVARKLDLSLIEQSDLIVDTAHGFQGDERDVMLFSPVVSPDFPRGARYFLAATGNLFNVAITRARAVLHVIGDLDACSACGVPHVEGFAAYTRALGDELTPSSVSETRIGLWEKPLHQALEERGLSPIAQYAVNQYHLDLAFPIAEPPLAIEVDGELFHREWDGARCREDLIRDMRLAALGWRVKRFWVYEVRDELDRCVEEVRELLAADS